MDNAIKDIKRYLMMIGNMTRFEVISEEDILLEY